LLVYGDVGRRGSTFCSSTRREQAVDRERGLRQPGAALDHLAGGEARTIRARAGRRARRSVGGMTGKRAGRPRFQRLGEVVGRRCRFVGGAGVKVDMAVAVEVNPRICEGSRAMNAPSCRALRHSCRARRGVDALVLHSTETVSPSSSLRRHCDPHALGSRTPASTSAVDDAKRLPICRTKIVLDADDAADDLGRHAYRSSAWPRPAWLRQKARGADAIARRKRAIGGPVLAVPSSEA